MLLTAKNDGAQSGDRRKPGSLAQSRSLAFLSPRQEPGLQGTDNLFRLESSKHSKG